MEVLGILIQKTNKKSGKKEWALVSKKDRSKILKWFGVRKPSDEQVKKEEKRVQHWKHAKGSYQAIKAYIKPLIQDMELYKTIKAEIKRVMADEMLPVEITKFFRRENKKDLSDLEYSLENYFNFLKPFIEVVYYRCEGNSLHFYVTLDFDTDGGELKPEIKTRIEKTVKSLGGSGLNIKEKKADEDSNEYSYEARFVAPLVYL